MRVKYSEILFFLGMIAIMFGNLFMVTAYPFVYPGVAIILKLVRYLGYMIIILKILYDLFYIKDLIKMLICLCILQVIVVFFTLLGCGLHVIPDVIFDLDNRIRHTVGFYYVSYLPHIYTMLVIVWLYLKRYTIKFYEYILITIVNILVYRVSATRVDFAIVFLAILLHIIVSNGIVIRQLKAVIKFILKNSTLLCATCMLVLTII